MRNFLSNLRRGQMQQYAANYGFITTFVVLITTVIIGCNFPLDPAAPGQRPDFQTTQFRYVNITNSSAMHVLEAQFTIFNSASNSTSLSPVRTGAVSSQGISDFFVPLADSARISVEETGTSRARYSLALPILVNARNTSYTFVGLPSLRGQIVDTVIALTAPAPDTLLNTAGIRFINCINDSSLTYSVNLGCPSGVPLTSVSLRYRANSGFQQITLGGGNEVSVSLTEQSTVASVRSINRGLFRLSGLQVRNSYSFLIYRDRMGAVQILGLNDRSTSDRITVASVNQLATFLRVANFSRVAVDSVLYGVAQGRLIASSVQQNALTSYTSIVACASLGGDTIIIRRPTGLTRQILTASLEVGASQTIFVSDSLARSVPAFTGTLAENQVAVRVLNFSQSGISAFRGATTLMQARQIASNLAPGELSGITILPRDLLHPFVVFSVEASRRLLQNGIATPPRVGANPANSFILVVNNDNTMTLVPDSPQNATPVSPNSVSAMPKGAFVQAVHAFGDATAGTVSVLPLQIGMFLRDSIGFGAPVFTVVPAGATTVVMGNTQSQMVMFEQNVHYLLVGAGAGNARRILVERSIWTPRPQDGIFIPSNNQSTVRYCNASAITNRLIVSSDLTGDFTERAAMAAQTFSRMRQFFVSQTRTLSFQRDTLLPRSPSSGAMSGDSAAAIDLFILRNSAFSFPNRAYTVIFTGRTQPDTLNTAVVIQEF